MTLVLDTSILSRLCHPGKPQYVPVSRWLTMVLESNAARVVLPEIADYELRRKLLHLVRRQQASPRSLARLDELGRTLYYLPLTTPAMRRAAELWATSRLAGLPTAGPTSLDGDVIVAAQALEIRGTVITTNRKHLSRFVEVKGWEEINAQ